MNNDFGASLSGTAQQTGQNAINAFNPQDTASQQQGALGSNYNNQIQQGQNFQNQYAGAVAANPQMQQSYQTAQNLYNVPQLAQSSNYLNQQVANQYPQQVQLARGFDVSAPQIDNATNTALRFLQPQANAAQQNLNTAQGLAQGYVTQQQAQNNMNLLPVQNQAALMSQAQNNQAQGLNSIQSNEFNGLIQKMNSGVALSATEMARANQLASIEEAYAQQQSQNQTTIANTIQGQKYIPVGNGTNLVNTFAQGIINPGIMTQQGNGQARY